MANCRGKTSHRNQRLNLFLRCARFDVGPATWPGVPGPVSARLTLRLLCEDAAGDGLSRAAGLGAVECPGRCGCHLGGGRLVGAGLRQGARGDRFGCAACSGRPEHVRSLRGDAGRSSFVLRHVQSPLLKGRYEPWNSASTCFMDQSISPLWHKRCNTGSRVRQ